MPTPASQACVTQRTQDGDQGPAERGALSLPPPLALQECTPILPDMLWVCCPSPLARVL